MPNTLKRSRGRPAGSGAIDPDVILSAALDALADGGYASMSMRAIARSVGVSLATVQHHFGTKAKLWQAAIDYYFDRVTERQGREVESGLKQRIALALDLSSERPGLVSALLSDREPGASERLDYLAQRFGPMAEQQTEILARRQREGTMRPVDLRALRLLMALGINSIAAAPEAVKQVYGYDLADPADRDHVASALADIIGNGLRP